MQRALMTALFLLVLLITPVQAGATSETAVILRWAPVIHQQDNDQNPLSRENIFTVANFDLDWRMNNNWGNLPYYPPGAAVYYSLVESDTHYFIGYYLYYPRHIGKVQHEHDMAGVLAVVQKGSEQLELLLTYNHNEFLKWNGSHVRLEAGHPSLVVSAGTHEISLVKTYEAAPGPGGIFPLPPEKQVPATGGQTGTASSAVYRLVDLKELWQRCNDIGQSRTFSRWGYFDSYYYFDAAVPWMWEYNRINWLAKPAELVRRIHGNDRQPITYLKNPYAGIR
jgi:hypothetical protein